jgi:hypothetical protein
MRAVYVFLVWLIAVAIVTATRGMLPLQIVVILAAGLGYTRFTARNASLQHGLGVGVIWTTFCIVAEIGLNVPLLGGAGALSRLPHLLLPHLDRGSRPDRSPPRRGQTGTVYPFANSPALRRPRSYLSQEIPFLSSPDPGP